MLHIYRTFRDIKKFVLFVYIPDCIILVEAPDFRMLLFSKLTMASIGRQVIKSMTLDYLFPIFETRKHPYQQLLPLHPPNTFVTPTAFLSVRIYLARTISLLSAYRSLEHLCFETQRFKKSFVLFLIFYLKKESKIFQRSGLDSLKKNDVVASI